MKSYKKILLTAAATLMLGANAFAADKLRIGTEGAYPPFNLIDASGQVVAICVCELRVSILHVVMVRVIHLRPILVGVEAAWHPARRPAPVRSAAFATIMVASALTAVMVASALTAIMVASAVTAAMVATAARIDDRPCAFRYPRGEGEGVEIPLPAVPLEIGKGRILREGNTVAILSFGTRLGESLKAAEDLTAKGYSTTVADARFCKPLDEDLVCELARNHQVLITIEEGAIGGFAAHVLQCLERHELLDNGLKIRTMMLPDSFIDHGAPGDMYATAGLNAPDIVVKALSALSSAGSSEGQVNEAGAPKLA